MKTPLSESIDPNDQGRISEEEMMPAEENNYVDGTEKSLMDKQLDESFDSGFMDALCQVINLQSVKTKLTTDEIIEILQLYNKS